MFFIGVGFSPTVAFHSVACQPMTVLFCPVLSSLSSSFLYPDREGDANISPEPLASAKYLSRLRGQRHPMLRLAFMRSAGTVQTLLKIDLARRQS